MEYVYSAGCVQPLAAYAYLHSAEIHCNVGLSMDYDHRPTELRMGQWVMGQYM